MVLSKYAKVKVNTKLFHSKKKGETKWGMQESAKDKMILQKLTCVIAQV